MLADLEDFCASGEKNLFNLFNTKMSGLEIEDEGLKAIYNNN